MCSVSSIAGGMPAFSSSGAEDANLFAEVLLKGGRLNTRDRDQLRFEVQEAP